MFTRHLRTLPSLLLALLFVASAAAQTSTEPTSWELRVCADPDILPFSGRETPGFENRIAEIVADQLQARLTYDWSAFTSDMVNLRFGEGECDVLLGVPDGFEQGITTIAYYQSPYVMIYRADSGLELDSLDDPALAEGLRLGVQGLGTPPHEALRQRDLLGAVTEVFGGELGDEHLAVLVRAVEEGRVDVGFGWGPAIGYYAARSEVELTVVPVEPAFDFPAIVQSLPMTMAVRRDDVALRDQLNVAIAERWHDIQQVLAEFDVPVLAQPEPYLGERDTGVVENTLQVGLITPMPTGARTRYAGIYTVTGDAVRMGALLAEGTVNAAAGRSGSDVRLLLSNAPSAASAERAAERLLSIGGAQALVGGLGEGQAEVLAAVAARYGVPFLNVGSSSQLLRLACPATTFHVQPSAATYLAAMVASYRAHPAGAQRWYVVHEEGAEGEARLAVANALVAAAGDELVGSTAVAPERPVYHDLFDAIEAVDADAVMVLLTPPDQLAFIGQAADAGLPVLMAPFPDPITQTRDFLAASTRYGVGVDLPRLMLWEATLDDGTAGALNERFASRWGQPLDAVGWAAHRAVTLLADAVERAASTEPAAVLAELAHGDFGPDRERTDPLYLVKPNPAAPWGLTLSERLAAANLIGEAPRGPQLPASGCD